MAQGYAQNYWIGAQDPRPPSLSQRAVAAVFVLAVLLAMTMALMLVT
jgi:hypothetical protein